MTAASALKKLRKNFADWTRPLRLSRDVVLWQDLLEMHVRRAEGKTVPASFTEQARERAARIAGAKGAFLRFVADNFDQSNAQLFQDLFALFANKGKKGGFFVEFGATNGLSLSNSYVLEKEYGWNGILAEPAPIWHADLRKNRSVIIENRCVWKDSGKTLSFSQTEYPELSTISAFSNSDMHATSRAAASSFEVQTISLNDLLNTYAHGTIDYMSVDTEGSELEILSAFDFSPHTINVITVEHNYHQSKRSGLHGLLTDNGFRRVFQDLSRFDDWYIRSSLDIG
jgi:FkbM family methyltransferase